MMFYVRIVNNDASTALFGGMNYANAEALFNRLAYRSETIFAMWGDAGGDLINTRVPAEQE